MKTWKCPVCCEERWSHGYIDLVFCSCGMLMNELLTKCWLTVVPWEPEGER